ncbi:MAG: hypothetical protein JWN98_2225, partial [Abditibacteriota bacterium]|nr:hypothetical protein [Abditibacteriota bacterium]
AELSRSVAGEETRLTLSSRAPKMALRGGDFEVALLGIRSVLNLE